jgi:hypothetical protein
VKGSAATLSVHDGTRQPATFPREGRYVAPCVKGTVLVFHTKSFWCAERAANGRPLTPCPQVLVHPFLCKLKDDDTVFLTNATLDMFEYQLKV